MKKVKMLFVLALVAGIGQSASGQEAAQDGQEQLTRDQLRAAVQGICPVSGKKLGDHGTPIKVQIGQEMIFLCCKGCLRRKPNSQFWATIHANMASAQAKCPVMGKALPKNPKWTIAEGQIVYVCCPPCIKKIVADPETYLKKVDAFYAASLKARQDAR